MSTSLFHYSIFSNFILLKVGGDRFVRVFFCYVEIKTYQNNEEGVEMEKIKTENYEIHKGTMAIIPVAHLTYQSEIIEEDRRVYVPIKPISLIKEGCLEGGADYAGRRAAVMHQTGISQKVPIPINPLEEIYAFPTHSAKHFDCCWIFYKHVKRITPDGNQTIITFRNNEQLKVNVSHYIIEKQMHRTAYCFIRFSNRLIGPNQLG